MKKSAEGATITAWVGYLSHILSSQNILHNNIPHISFDISRIKASIKDLLCHVCHSSAKMESQQQYNVPFSLFTSPGLIMLSKQCLFIFMKLAENPVAQISFI